MLKYPSIMSMGQSRIPKGALCHAFMKYDGSNVRFEWTPKSGFHKFGTRERLFDHTDPLFGAVVEMARDHIGPRLLADARDWDKRALSNAGRLVGFAEFFGRSSFAGSHADEPKSLVVFDVSFGGKELLGPKSFLEIAQGQAEYARHLGQIVYNEELARSVHRGEFDYGGDFGQDMFEGIILKREARQGVESTKLKTKAWLDAVKGRFPDWESRI